MEMYRKPAMTETRWASFENPTGEKGEGARENQGAKGHAFDCIKPGATVVLLQCEGCGIVNRIWLTVSDRSPEMLRSLRIEMHWDGAKRPAVSAPLGDFFGASLGRLVPFENALFCSPEGRSFNSYVQMPFRKAARIAITNESSRDLSHIFYDVNYSRERSHDRDVLYFHAHWRRERPTKLERDFEILPTIEGAGRFLGSNIGVIPDPIYTGSWWGEGEAKVYLDGDSAHPTLVGTGTEDYIGTAWGQGPYCGRYQGCLIADKENGQWGFFRLHVPDPVFFHRSCRVTLQQIGGAPKSTILKLLEKKALLKIVSTDKGGTFTKVLDRGKEFRVEDEEVDPGIWCNFYREDDVSATAYFYLDSPENSLPDIAQPAARIFGSIQQDTRR